LLLKPLGIGNNGEISGLVGFIGLALVAIKARGHQRSTPDAEGGGRLKPSADFRCVMRRGLVVLLTQVVR